MLLYWGMFTVGFTIGAIFAYITFANKNLDEEAKRQTEEQTKLSNNSMNSNGIEEENYSGDFRSLPN